MVYHILEKQNKTKVCRLSGTFAATTDPAHTHSGTHGIARLTIRRLTRR